MRTVLIPALASLSTSYSVNHESLQKFNGVNKILYTIFKDRTHQCCAKVSSTVLGYASENALHHTA